MKHPVYMSGQHSPLPSASDVLVQVPFYAVIAWCLGTGTALCLLLFITRYLQQSKHMHRDRVFLPACFIYRTIEWIPIKLCTDIRHLELCGEFNFGSYRSHISPTLYEVQIRLYRFLQNRLIIQKIVT